MRSILTILLLNKQWMFVSWPCISCDLEVFRIVFGSNLSLFFALKKGLLVDGKTFHLKSIHIGYRLDTSITNSSWFKQIFLIFFVLLKNWLILHYLKVDYKPLIEVLWWRSMLSIHPEVQDFGHEDEMNYKTDEVNKEKMKEFCILIAGRKSENTKHTTKYYKQTLWCFVERRTSRGK